MSFNLSRSIGIQGVKQDIKQYSHIFSPDDSHDSEDDDHDDDDDFDDYDYSFDSLWILLKLEYEIKLRCLKVLSP